MERNPNLDSGPRTERTATLPEGPAFRGPFRSLRRLGVIARRPEGRNGELAEVLEADALLLREENARLRVKLEAAPNAGHVIERLRALPAPSVTAEHGDEAWQMLTDLIVMRNSMIEICRELGQVMAGFEKSLESISPPDGFAVEGNAENGPPRNGLRTNGHLKEARQS